MARDLKKNVAKTFSFLGLFIIVFSVIIIGIINYSSEESFIGWGQTLAEAMLFYLIFIAIRSSMLLTFSSLEYAYEKVIAPPSFYPLISIIVPCFNEAKVITKAIESLLKINYPNYEIIVVDDGSMDLTLSIAKKFEDSRRLKVIYQANAGKAMALNRGIQEAVGDYVLCVDADSVLNSDVLLHAMSYFEQDKRLAAVAGCVEVGNYKEGMLTLFQKLEYIVGLNLHKRAQSFLNIVTIVPGPIGVFKKDFLLQVGGYSSNTFAEDCDLSMRLILNGYNIKYCSKMIAYTEAPYEIMTLMTQRYRWTRGMIQAIATNTLWFNPIKTSFRNLFIMFYMLIETIFIPCANYIFALLAITYALTYGIGQIFGPYFIALTVLDMAIALYSIVFESQVRSLFFLAMINRFTYGLMLEIVRFYSMFDEIFNLPMKWGVIPRRGMKL